MLLSCLSEQHFASVNLWLIDVKTVFMKMKVLLLVLFLCISGLTFGAQATEQDDSSPIMESKFSESQETELDSVNDDKSDDEAEKHLRKRGMMNTTNWRPTTSSPRFCNHNCLNGGTKICHPDRRHYCLCRGFYTGDRCQYGRSGPTTRFFSRFTTSPPFTRFCNHNCFNGGTKVCHPDRRHYCRCRRGYSGDRCQFGFTTRRPKFYTPGWFLAHRYRRCYKCRIASSMRQCVSQTFCPGECFQGKATLRNDGRTFFFAGCRYSFGHQFFNCQKTCNEAYRKGLVSRCSIRCCRGDLCNGRGQLPTSRPFTRPWLRTRRPWFTRRPTARHRVILRVVWRLLRALKSIIDAFTILLKSHMNGGRARGYKREITSMIDKVDFHAQQLEDSRDSEVLRVKQDVSATRMRAQAIIKKLDEFIGEDSNDDSKK